ncbi:MAG TPA: tripartite tricarboxylate transporter TctB family protein [Alphaproteobacteria bacterium]|nr:tripartite tricarboxylate transporter TctB family protein [Alphaproteobacteria bacterium]
MSNESRRRDWPGMIVAIVFILLGLWVIQQSLSMSALGSIFPRTIAIALIAFSTILLVANLRPVRGTRAPDQEAASASPESTPRRLALVIIMLAWVLLMPVIGFLVSSVSAFLAILAVANYDGWTAKRTVVYVVTTVVVVAAFYFLMVEVLLIPVPRGFLI